MSRARFFVGVKAITTPGKIAAATKFLREGRMEEGSPEGSGGRGLRSNSDDLACCVGVCRVIRKPFPVKKVRTKARKIGTILSIRLIIYITQLLNWFLSLRTFCDLISSVIIQMPRTFFIISKHDWI